MIKSKFCWQSSIKLGLAAAITISTLAACVSATKYDALMEEKVDLERKHLVIKRELNLQDAELAQMKSEQADLEKDLAQLITAGQLKMELLANGLHLDLSEEVLFAPNDAQLTDSGKKLIIALVDELAEIPYQIIVTGNTDNVALSGAVLDQYPSNWELAGARASSVVRLMESKGIPSTQLAAISLGSARPMASNDTEEGRAENRNIEIFLRPVIN